MVDARQLGSYLSEISSRLRSSGLASPSSRRSPRSSRVIGLSCKGGEAPDEELQSASSAGRHLRARHLAFWADRDAGSWMELRVTGAQNQCECHGVCLASSLGLLLLTQPSPAQTGHGSPCSTTGNSGSEVHSLPEDTALGSRNGTMSCLARPEGAPRL